MVKGLRKRYPDLPGSAVGSASRGPYAVDILGQRPVRLRPSLDATTCPQGERRNRDRKSTRLNSSHSQISYAVFCLKKKNYAELAQKYPGRFNAVLSLPLPHIDAALREMERG